jgi:hypothetical protein
MLPSNRKGGGMRIEFRLASMGAPSLDGSKRRYILISIKTFQAPSLQNELRLSERGCP